MEPPTKQAIAQSANSTFRPHEFNEIIRIVYRFLSAAIVRGRVDTLTITKTHFEWSYGERVLSRFDLEPLPYQRVSYYDAFHLILVRDAYIQNFVHLVKSSASEEVYHIGIDIPFQQNERDS